METWLCMCMMEAYHFEDKDVRIENIFLALGQGLSSGVWSLHKINNAS